MTLIIQAQGYQGKCQNHPVNSHRDGPTFLCALFDFTNMPQSNRHRNMLHVLTAKQKQQLAKFIKSIIAEIAR